MHSSRMRTGRSLTICWHLLPGGGGVSLPGGLPAQGGSPCLGGFSLPGGGVCSGGLPAGGFSLPGGVLPARGCSPCPGGVLPARRPLPPVNRITHMCKKHNLGHNFVAAGNKPSSDVQMVFFLVSKQ